MVIGNYLGKIRNNYFSGVRTPWTLSSELSWNKTHRLAGKLFVILGLLVCVAGIADSIWLFLATLIVLLPAMLVVIFVYSYAVWKTDPDRKIS